MTPPKVRPTCDQMIKTEDLEIKKCLAFTVGGRCPNKDRHMVTKTGFCENGNCEGTAKVSPGKRIAQPTCTWWQRCMCKCHELYDRMFKMSETPRTLVDNSGYEAPIGHFKMPSAEERARMAALSNPNRNDTPIVIESPAPGLVPVTITRAFAPTATGHAARGELESWVNEHCGVWLVEAESFPCTPVYLAKEIGRKQGIDPPSVGAISAVFERWKKLDYAEIGAKPTRFIKYTDTGIKYGLADLKERAKRASRMKQATQARGALR